MPLPCKSAGSRCSECHLLGQLDTHVTIFLSNNIGLDNLFLQLLLKPIQVDGPVAGMDFLVIVEKQL